MKFSAIAIYLILAPLFSMASDHRDSSNIERDQYRHPAKTLAFFDIQPGQNVVEIWPGGGWYTEVLAEKMQGKGQLIAAHFPKDSGVNFFRRSRQQFEDKVAQQPHNYKNLTFSDFEPPRHISIATPSSADKVLTFRNVHNWMRNDSEQLAFNAFFKALKPGGMLGVVEHRAPESFNLQQMVDSGYVSQWYVIKLAKKAGFVLLGESEINANKLDTKSHPNGVWTLPPTLRIKGADNIKKYKAIGESDRMTLKFIKPKFN